MAALGRAITFPGQQFGNLGVINTLARQVEQAGLHLGATGQGLQPIYRLLDHEVADLPTAPDDAHADAIGRRPPQHDLVDQAAQQRLPALPGHVRLLPEGRELRAKRDEAFPILGRQRLRRGAFRPMP